MKFIYAFMALFLSGIPHMLYKGETLGAFLVLLALICAATVGILLGMEAFGKKLCDRDLQRRLAKVTIAQCEGCGEKDNGEQCAGCYIRKYGATDDEIKKWWRS